MSEVPAVEVVKEPPIIQLTAVESNPLTKAQTTADFRKKLANLVFKEEPVEQIQEVNNETVLDRDVEGSASDSSDNAGDDDVAVRDTADEVEDNEPKKISRYRLNKEVEKRKELEEMLREERDSRIKYETELKLYSDALGSLKKTTPEPTLDPLDSDAHQFYMSRINELESRITKSTEHLSQSNQQTRFEAAVNSQAMEFAKKSPDFESAYSFVLEKETENAKLIGLNEREAQQFAIDKLKPIAWKIYNDGGNVAETLYKLAKNYGFASKTVQKSGPDLKSLQKNMPKSGSIIDDVSSISVSTVNPESNYTKMDNFKQLHRQSGYGIDPDKFRRALEEVQKGSR